MLFFCENVPKTTTTTPCHCPFDICSFSRLARTDTVRGALSMKRKKKKIEQIQTCFQRLLVIFQLHSSRDFDVSMQFMAGSGDHRVHRGASCSLYLTAPYYTNGGVDGRAYAKKDKSLKLIIRIGRSPHEQIIL